MSAPTIDHLQRAFALLHRPDWPAHNLTELLTVARHAALVQGLAQRLAGGQGITRPPVPTPLADQPPPEPVPLRCWDFPPRRSGCQPGGPARRRSDGPDLKRLASGDRDD